MTYLTLMSDGLRRIVKTGERPWPAASDRARFRFWRRPLADARGSELGRSKMAVSRRGKSFGFDSAKGDMFKSRESDNGPRAAYP